MESREISYIVGARLKNLSDKISGKILQHDFTANPILRVTMGQQKLIVDYSVERAKKDEKIRDRLVTKLKARLKKKVSLIRWRKPWKYWVKSDREKSV